MGGGGGGPPFFYFPVPLHLRCVCGGGGVKFSLLYFGSSDFLVNHARFSSKSL